MRDISVIAAAVPGAEIRDSSLVVKAEAIVSSLQAIKNLGGFMLFDICEVDRPEAFEVCYRLVDMREGGKDTLAVRVFLDHDKPEVPSVMGVWKSADVLEREAWDLMGIKFTGRAAMGRVLTADDFVGHPLRKDFVMPKRDRFPAESWDKKAAEGGM